MTIKEYVNQYGDAVTYMTGEEYSEVYIKPLCLSCKFCNEIYILTNDIDQKYVNYVGCEIYPDRNTSNFKIECVDYKKRRIVKKDKVQ